MSEEIASFASSHPVGFCRMPESFATSEMLSASSRFIAPKVVDCRDYCTPTEDQGAKPWCAAYAAANWAENVLWRKTDTITQIDPTWIYSYAKSIDGDPKGDGTTLTAVLEALLNKGLFSRSVCRVRTISANRCAIKYTVHKFGAVLGGFNVTDEWYGCNKNDCVIRGERNRPMIGGHAVVLCGYDQEGVWIQNSWAAGWGHYGFGKVTWDEVDRTFMYGSVLSNCLDGMTV
ncbi:MAG: C1 family peptidase [Bacteroidales bacterium]|nr:C1 family peptidase [Bacteroidales bacterium]